ncbi:MAG: anti-sigma factor family protein [Armatimonadota bacterium]
MHCDSAKIWLSDAPDADPRWTDHLASCASCRAEADRAEQLSRAMRELPRQETPADVTARLQQLSAATGTRSLECAETLELLEPYREGLLATEESFLVEDHLLWCASCAGALETADVLATAMRALPQMAPPDSIAERLALARLPWWQRLWTAPAPSWSLRRLLQVSGAMAAAALLFAVMVNVKPGTKTAELPKDNHQAVVTTTTADDPGEQASGPETAPKSVGVPATARPVEMTKPTPAEDPKVKVPAVQPAIAIAFQIDPMAVPVSKALLSSAGFRPEATIQRESAPKETPIQAKIDREKDFVRPYTEEVKTVNGVTAREKLLEMNDAYALACMEEELSSPGKIVPSVRPEAPRPASPAPLMIASTEEVSRTVSKSLKRDNTATALAPITVKSTHVPERIGGTVIAITMGSDG